MKKNISYCLFFALLILVSGCKQKMKQNPLLLKKLLTSLPVRNIQPGMTLTPTAKIDVESAISTSLLSG